MEDIKRNRTRNVLVRASYDQRLSHPFEVIGVIGHQD